MKAAGNCQKNRTGLQNAQGRAPQAVSWRHSADEILPVCELCGGVVKTATISFGQAMPEAAMQRANEETLACDLFLAIGSSLTVYPAAGFPALAKKNRAGLVIINREPTGLDDLADLVIHAEIGPALDAAVNP
jgi:NAD-dependent deacetylase